jgi:type I restriction enzyme, S subunit
MPTHSLLKGASRIPIGHLCTLQNGRAFKSSEWSDSGTPIIRIQNLRDSTKPFNHYSGGLPERFRVRKGDVLLSWSGTPETSFGCFRWSGMEGWLNQHIFNVRLNQQCVLPDYFVLHVNAVLSELIRRAHGGVGLRHITKDQLVQIELSVPSLETQRFVVDLLSRTENIVLMRREAEQKAKEIVPALFLDMLGDPVTNPKGWGVHPLSDVVLSFQGGKNVQAGSPGESPYRLLKISAVTAGVFDESAAKPAPKGFDPPVHYFVRKGDLLFSRANTEELVGATAFVTETDGKSLLPDKLWRFVWRNAEAIEPLYMLALLQNREVRRMLSSTGDTNENSRRRVFSVPL